MMLAGRRALVTGGRRGLGRAIAAALAHAGAAVAISHEGAHDAAEAFHRHRPGLAVGAHHPFALPLEQPALQRLALGGQ